MREELIGRLFDVLWPLQEWNGEEAVCRAACSTALDAILTGLDDPSEEMEEAAREQWELGSPSSILRAMLKPLKGE